MTGSIHIGLPFAEYQALDAVNIGSLVDIGEAPALFAWRKEHPRPDTPAMRMGRAIHTALLQPELFEEEFAVGPPVTRRTREWKDWADAQPDDVTLLTAEEGREVSELTEAVLARSNPSALLSSSGTSELTVRWEHRGVACKGRIDRTLDTEAGPVLLELKTVAKGGLTPEGWARDIAKWRYHVRAAWYLDGYKRATGTECRGFYFLVVQRTPPYLSACYSLDAEAIELGRRECEALITTYLHCGAYDVWSDPSESIEPVGIPAWYTPILPLDPK